MSGYRTKIKAAKVTKLASGKVVLEPTPYYGKMDASARIRARTSKRVRVVKSSGVQT
jgi:hypothetical protein